MPSLMPFRTALRTPATAHILPMRCTQSFQTSQTTCMAYKDDQNRESLKPKAHDNTISGTDDEAAANEDAAFNPEKTSPETAKDTMGKGGGVGNPLEFSPANKEMARGGQGHADGKPQAGDNSKSSGGSSTSKGK
ncbi:hypothetical protein BKA67DRAFT_569367 [Truncatella angustata]|uniref:Uncharacterized protein n=1 Tax=Truncatella angustata TaxID=152316 RepID=A0A9P8ZWT9_9PEZI|nr:uncharacterized protein BKA67DRAFT_569367 [Truncatella angustata]KAH6653386.1 hypothetical protein BKA67DRAFT_569367 [Truncatella angustata]